MLTVCLATLLVLVALTGTAREPGSRRLYEQWRRADADGDGQLSRREASALGTLARHFDAIDQNRDGLLSAEEVRAWRSRGAVRYRSAPQRAFPSWLARSDTDADGVLSRPEAEASLPRLAARFEEIAADRDGRLSREEIETWLAGRRAVRSIAR